MQLLFRFFLIFFRLSIEFQRSWQEIVPGRLSQTHNLTNLIFTYQIDKLESKIRKKYAFLLNMCFFSCHFKINEVIRSKNFQK
jgi:hypothetical protein